MPTQREDWDVIAPHWDESVGEGNDFQKLLIVPATDRLLAPGPGMRVLDACCGNGNYARKLARNGCDVLAFDGSRVMIDLARKRGATAPDSVPRPVTYAVADACSPDELRTALSGWTFDAAVCSMALMDLPELAPLLTSVRSTLIPGGPFVVSVCHPSFHSNESLKWATQSDGEGEASQTFGCLVTRYATDWPHDSRGLLTQPIPHRLYHRSLSTLLAACFQAGFTIDGLEEPTFPPDTRLRSPFSWARRPDIPPVLILRLR